MLSCGGWHNGIVPDFTGNVQYFVNAIETSTIRARVQTTISEHKHCRAFHTEWRWVWMALALGNWEKSRIILTSFSWFTMLFFLLCKCSSGGCCDSPFLMLCNAACGLYPIKTSLALHFCFSIWNKLRNFRLRSRALIQNHIHTHRVFSPVMWLERI